MSGGNLSEILQEHALKFIFSYWLIVSACSAGQPDEIIQRYFSWLPYLYRYGDIVLHTFETGNNDIIVGSSCDKSNIVWNHNIVFCNCSSNAYGRSFSIIFILTIIMWTCYDTVVDSMTSRFLKIWVRFRLGLIAWNIAWKSTGQFMQFKASFSNVACSYKASKVKRCENKLIAWQRYCECEADAKTIAEIASEREYFISQDVFNTPPPPPPLPPLS